MALMNSMENVDSVEKEETEEEGCVKVTLFTQKSVDIREQVFYKLAEAHMPILSMQKVEKSLEDIFLELTGESSNAEEVPADTAVAESVQDTESETETLEESQKKEDN